MSAARRTAFWIALACVLAGALAIVAPSLRETYATTRAFELARGSGWLAAIALLAALAISPLRRIRRVLGRPESGWLAALRRSFGIAAASCGIVHAGYSLVSLPGITESLLELGWLRAGVAAVVTSSVLLVTSFESVLRRLRLQHWAEVHWLVYPVALLVAAHAVLGPAGTPAFELTFCLVTALLLGLRLVFTRARTSKSSAE